MESQPSGGQGYFTTTENCPWMHDEQNFNIVYQPEINPSE